MQLGDIGYKGGRIVIIVNSTANEAQRVQKIELAKTESVTCFHCGKKVLFDRGAIAAAILKLHRSTCSARQHVQKPSIEFFY